MLSGFFIDQPKFAIVVAIVIMLAGSLALSVIPVAQFPNITPPQINVSASSSCRCCSSPSSGWHSAPRA